MTKETVARRNSNNKKSGSLPYQTLLYAVGGILIADLLVMALALLGIGGETGRVYLQTVLFPLAAFVGGFFSLVATRHVLVCLTSSLVVHALLYCIALGFNVGMFLWLLLYLISGFVGLSIAYIVLTHKS